MNKSAQARRGEELLELHSLLFKRRWDLEPRNVLQVNMLGLLDRDSVAAKYPALEPFTAEIRQHTGFVWLNRSSDFVRARRLFLDAGGAASRWIWERLIDEVEFVSAVVFWTGLALSAPNWTPNLPPSAVAKRRVIKQCRDLLESIQGGVGPSNPIENETLKGSLVRLSQEFSSPTPRPYRGADTRQKSLLTELAKNLLRKRLPRDLVSSLVETLAPLMEFRPVQRTVQRYVHEAVAAVALEQAEATSRERSKALGKALLRG